MTNHADDEREAEAEAYQEWLDGEQSVSDALHFTANPESEDHAATVTGDREKLIYPCSHSENCNHRFRLWNLLVDHANGSRRRGKGSPNEESRVAIVFEWMAQEGFALAAPVEVDEAKLAEVLSLNANLDDATGTTIKLDDALIAVTEWLRGEYR